MRGRKGLSVIMKGKVSWESRLREKEREREMKMLFPASVINPVLNEGTVERCFARLRRRRNTPELQQAGNMMECDL